MNRSHKFFAELNKLLGKYKVEIIAQDDGRPYGMHSAEILFDFDYMQEDYGTFEDQVIETRLAFEEPTATTHQEVTDNKGE